MHAQRFKVTQFGLGILRFTEKQAASYKIVYIGYQHALLTVCFSTSSPCEKSRRQVEIWPRAEDFRIPYFVQKHIDDIISNELCIPPEDFVDFIPERCHIHDDHDDDCPPVPNDCPPDCIKYDEPHCRKCQCSSKDSGSGMSSPFSATSMGGSPFNQGPSLFQNPYSASMSGGGFQMSPMMALSGGRSTLPSMFMHGGTLMMGGSKRKCLKNIVCPSYCHEIDEHGCETCPCGPANGINPPGKEEEQKDNQQDKQKDQKDSQCTQTLLCMLSCKDGYELGQKGKDGCQTCKCTKSKGDNSPKQTGQLGNSMMGGNSGSGESNGGGGGGFDMSGGGDGSAGSGLSSYGGSGVASSSSGGFNPLFPGSNMGGGGMGGGGGDSGSQCAGPFCAGGGGGGGMGGGGGGMGGGKMISPFGLAAGMGMGGGGKGGAGGASVPGRDCFGPECSAKNGMKLVHTENTEKSCPLTDICIKSCRYDLKLGQKGKDGCPSCACVKNKGTPKTCDVVIKCMLECDGEYTLSESKDSECPSCICNSVSGSASVSTSAHKETSLCDDMVVKCMKDCRHGYHLQAVSGRQCPSCKCLPPPPTSAPVPQKASVYDLLHECPNTIQCMTNCKSGYDLQTTSGQHCPVCRCNTAVVATLMCVTSLTCRNGCVYGYKKGPDGCPTCACIEATAVGFSPHASIYVQSSVSCNAHFSCGSQCEYGYVSGSNKCPSCQCLEPVQVHHISSGCSGPDCVVPSSIHGNLLSHHTITPSKEVALSHLSLSSKETLSVLVKYCSGVAKCVSTCKTGFTLSGAVVGKCPTCLCTGKVGVATHLVGSAIDGTSVITSGGAGIVHTGSVPSVNVGVGPHYIGNTHATTNSGQHVIVSNPVKTVSPTHHNLPPKTSGHTSNGGGTSTVGGAVVSGTSPPAANGGSGGMLPGGPQGAAHIGSIGGGGGNNKLPGPMNAVSSHLGGLSKYPLVPVGHSNIGSDCIGPACSAKNGMHRAQEDTPLTPGQCPDIMHCVLNCKHGYKLLPGKEKNCPGCQCVVKQTIVSMN